MLTSCGMDYHWIHQKFSMDFHHKGHILLNSKMSLKQQFTVHHVVPFINKKRPKSTNFWAITNRQQHITTCRGLYFVCMSCFTQVLEIVENFSSKQPYFPIRKTAQSYTAHQQPDFCGSYLNVIMPICLSMPIVLPSLKVEFMYLIQLREKVQGQLGDLQAVTPVTGQ